nr:hypothetical protein [Saprospiraceae bacterium]
MRIVNQIPHSLFVVEVFVYGEKYTLKIKYKGLEQSFPLPADQLAFISSKLGTSDHPFFKEVLQNFDAMQRSRINLLQSLNESESAEEEEII